MQCLFSGPSLLQSSGAEGAPPAKGVEPAGRPEEDSPEKVPDPKVVPERTISPPEVVHAPAASPAPTPSPEEPFGGYEHRNAIVDRDSLPAVWEIRGDQAPSRVLI